MLRIALALTALMATGCYLSHERGGTPGTDGGRPRDSAPVDAPFDAGVDLGPADAGCEPALADGSVTVPLDGGTLVTTCGAAYGSCAEPGTPDADRDGDGYPTREDCNDCEAGINPGAFDIPGNGHDEDCDGRDGLPPCPPPELGDGPSPEAALSAMGLCRDAAEGWGVLDARLGSANLAAPLASEEQIAIVDSMGVNAPLAGSTMLSISSGAAREPTGLTALRCSNFDARHGFPPGFPVESPACPGVTSGWPHDSLGLEVRLKVPTNAVALSFASFFFTQEYPTFICSTFNDFYAVLLERDDGTAANIAFDGAGNPISVNASFLEACVAGTHGGREFRCELGTRPLGGTGFDSDSCAGRLPFRRIAGAGTGWLRTTTPVTGGEELTLRFMIWDSGDGWFDSMALIDAFEWVVRPPVGADCPVCT